jgi:2-dehydro-3-deoxyglucarate aldolase
MFLKEKLAKGSVCIGGWVMIGHPASAEIMGRSGLDWVAIDLEHTATSIDTAENLIRAIQYGGSEALVRLTNNDPNLIKRVMDAGASGVIVPMIETAEEAAKAVQALYYPPKGTRGVGLARAQHYGPGFEQYRAQLDSKTVCIVQIEHIRAVENLENILKVEGVDGYLLGPYDLSASMGLIGQIDHPDVQAAIQKVRAIARTLGKPGGIHIVEPDSLKLRKSIDDGFTFIGYSIDTRIIDSAYRNALTDIKKTGA